MDISKMSEEIIDKLWHEKSHRHEPMTYKNCGIKQIQKIHSLLHTGNDDIINNMQDIGEEFYIKDIEHDQRNYAGRFCFE